MRNSFVKSFWGVFGVMCLIVGMTNGSEKLWVNNALASAEFAYQNLRMPAGNYVWDTTNVLSTSCWDNFSQFGALVAFGTQQILEFNDVSLGLASLEVAQAILDWQLKHFWNPSPPGGFYAYSYSDGTHLDTAVQYSDDNCLAGVILYESHLLLVSLERPESPVSEYPLVTLLANATIQQAQLCARWAIDSQAWAAAQGGGFWWNVSTAPPGYNEQSFRPDNSLFLCANLFTELYDFTQDPQYLDWADKSLQWGIAELYNPETLMFSWYSDLNNTVNSSVFVYSNALGAYALHRFGIVTQQSSYLDRALNLSLTIYHTFWSSEANAFVESSLVTWAVSTTLSGWASKSLFEIALYHKSTELLD